MTFEKCTDPEERLRLARIALQKSAKDAIQVQDACNFSGVQISFHEACNAIREHFHASDSFTSGGFANHPIIVLFMSKLTSMIMGSYADIPEFGKKYEACKRIALGDFSDIERNGEQ